MAPRIDRSFRDGAAGPGVAPDVQAYSTALQSAGGEEVNALTGLASDRVVCAALYAAPPYDLHVPGMDLSRLSLNLTPARVTGGIEGERPRNYDAHRYSLFMAPAGAEMHWRKSASSRHLTLYFRADLFDGDEESAGPLTRQALNNLSVPGLGPLVDQLVDELKHDGPYNVEAADCLAYLLLIQVSRHLKTAQDGTQALGTTSMKRLNDYVLAHLGERILVADLAREVGMSIDRFAWTCKAQTGQSPHQYVLALRLQQARHMLRHSSVAIAEVASACGFSNQQHLTNAMHRHTGVTPARYRKQSVSG